MIKETEKEKTFTGELIYEGEYLNDKRFEGKGKEFYPDFGNIIFFEGDYFNDNYWNGKFYYKNGKISLELKNGIGKGKICYNCEALYFDGEYKKGERNGKGIEFSIDEEILFEGEYLNNKRWNGKGKEYGNFEQLKFEGEYKDGNKIGKEYYDDIYELEGEKHKYGENILIYEGEFIDGKRWNGKGKEYMKGKLIFVGGYLNGQKINKDNKNDKTLKAKK